ncbi:hypothetical protein WN48_04429 [Eufriesea mexicana]|uniref:Uncharacterized protein n=1 Tax=Eufriesea mexicana TaxID=516756 RepID=A0A310SDQ9_9HYME|nr:hypothetical protein WN48_04429 [Eufriesea mexicana]
MPNHARFANETNSLRGRGAIVRATSSRAGNENHCGQRCTLTSAVGRSLMRRRLDRSDIEDPEDPRSIAMTNRETRPGGSFCDAKGPCGAATFFLRLRNVSVATKFIVLASTKPSAHVYRNLYAAGWLKQNPKRSVGQDQT